MSPIQQMFLGAGGPVSSPANGNFSVQFDGSGDKIKWGQSSNFVLSGDFTIEGWFYRKTMNNNHFWAIGEYSTAGGVLFYSYDEELYVQEWSPSRADREIIDPSPAKNQWHHIALVRSGSTINCYINGTSALSWTNSGDYGTSSNNTFWMGGSHASTGNVNISNLRVVKGQAIYTSNFTTPSSFLTTESQGVTTDKISLLCCNDSSASGSTISSSTFTSYGDPVSSTDNPFS